MTTEFGVKLDFETADKITVCCLKEAYSYMEKESEEIEQLDPIPGYKGEDLVYNKNMMKNIKAVLEYFGETV
jgi:hypothetical protein